MSMNHAGWAALGGIRRSKEQKALTPGTIRRAWSFIAQYRGRLIVYLVVSALGAVLTVVSPILAGDVVDAIVAGSNVKVVVRLALLIAGVALLEALDVISRWQSASLGERTIFDLRTAVLTTYKNADSVLHSSTHRCASFTAQQRCDWCTNCYCPNTSDSSQNIVTLGVTLVVISPRHGRSRWYLYYYCRCFFSPPGPLALALQV